LSYLLDTNICIALLNNRPPLTRLRVENAVADGHKIVLSTVVLHELCFGAAKSTRVSDSMAAIGNLFSEPYEILDYSSDAALAAARIRATLERTGTPIGSYDVLIAGQALTHNLKLATANVREFARVEGLEIIDWTK